MKIYFKSGLLLIVMTMWGCTSMVDDDLSLASSESTLLDHELFTVSSDNVAFNAVTYSSSGTFSTLNYNIAGILPEWLRDLGMDRGTDPANDIPKIMDRINQNGGEWDMIFFQEDFEYHNKVRNGLDQSIYPYKGKNNVSKNYTLLPVRDGYPLYYTGDGLYQFSKKRFEELKRWEFDDCHGDDCFARKGFTLGRFFLNDRVFIDIYNIHHDAGRKPQDMTIKKDGFNKLLDKIASASAGHSVIIVGDVNSRYARDGQDGIEIIKDAGFTDAFYEDLGLTNYYAPDSVAVANGEGVEKLLYRNDGLVILDATSYLERNEDFSNLNGEWSDHPPVQVDFDYSAIALSQVSLRNKKNDNYLTAQEGGGDGVRADANSIGSNEKFLIVSDDATPTALEDGGFIYLISVDGYYLNTDNNKRLKAESIGRDVYTRFKLVNHTRNGVAQSGDLLSLQSAQTGKWMQSDGSKANLKSSDNNGNAQRFYLTIH